MLELSSLGLSPTVLQELISDSPPNESTDAAEKKEGNNTDDGEQDAGEGEPSSPTGHDRPRIVYELVEHSDRIEPHLKVWVNVPDGSNLPTTLPKPEEAQEEEDGDVDEGEPKREMQPATNVLWTLHQRLHVDPIDPPTLDLSSESDGIEQYVFTPHAPIIPVNHIHRITTEGASTHTQELIIPLVSDTEFFKILVTALEGMSTHMVTLHHNFTKTLDDLSKTISATALPASASKSFNPHSRVTSHPGAIHVSAMQPRTSDLYAWREVFQLYVESEIFEHIGEVDHGERSSEEAEKRLQLFVRQATQRGLADPRHFKGKGSRQAWESFIELNMFILNIKKFSEASSEATRKILKKHTKRTALPLSFPFNKTTFTSPSSDVPSHLTLFSRFTTTTLPRTFVQALGETLLPIIPHVDDYSCLICTSLAFKPIRLNCGHLFCVRCLVKMQKRGQADCPLCRAAVVLTANKQNVDWAMLNFMQDWFPVEAKEKLKANEEEAAREQMEELGINPDSSACLVM
mgnify:CR=1 FL=1